MKCGNIDSICGMNNVEDRRCCFYCEYKSNCKGLCIEFEDSGDFEDVAKECEDFIDE